jgi:hypothetical protein
LPPDVLRSLASTIDDAFSYLGAEDPAQLLRVVTRPDAVDDIELGVLPLQPQVHPAEAMAGFTAPDTWSAIGVVAAARSAELTGTSFAARDERAAGPVRLTFLLSRSGRSATLLTPIGAPRAKRRVLCESPAGVVADACRLVLGLSTAEPTEGPEVWLTARWLDRLLTTAVDRPGAIRTWEAAARRHPLVSDRTPPTPEAVVALVQHAASEFDWERLRRLAARDAGTAPGISPGLASWMDAGCFARHLLAAELPIDLLMTELDALVPAPVMTAVRQALPPTCRGSR